MKHRILIRFIVDSPAPAMVIVDMLDRMLGVGALQDEISSFAKANAEGDVPLEFVDVQVAEEFSNIVKGWDEEWKKEL